MVRRRWQRRQVSEDELGAAHSMRWLLTYADMITLLLAFFIMVYSLSALDLPRFRAAAQSLRTELGPTLPEGGGSLLPGGGQGTPTRIVPLPAVPSPQAGKRCRWQVAQQASRENLRQFHAYLAQKRFARLIQVRAEERGLVVTLLADGLLFPAASARLTPECADVLGRLAEAIRQVPNDVCVEGHTCDLPPRGGAFASNWELSTTRATRVVRHLIEVEKIPPRRLSAAGYADTRPITANASARQRARNRRVDIVILAR